MDSPQTSSSTPARWDARLWGALIVLCGVVFLDALDVSMVGVALPSIRADLGLSTSELQWVVSGYVLAYGGLLLLGGRTADLLGRKRTLLIALGGFVVASALGGIAQDGTVLVAARFIKGLSAAFTAPAALSIITTTFPEGPARNRALSIFTTVGASGFSLGLVLGGALTEIGWRWTFLLAAPVAAGLLVAGPRLIPSDRGVSGGLRAFDIPGAVTVSAAMLLLVHTVVEAPTEGWTSVATIGGFAGAAALLALFVVIEQRARQPLVRLGIFRSGSLVRANLLAMAMFGGYLGFQFIGTLYMQSLLGWSPIVTALAFLPAGLIVVVGSTRVGALFDRFGTPRLIAVGFALFAVAYALFLRIDDTPVYAAVILPTIVLLGLGFALVFPSVNIQATAGVADHEQGLAGGLVNSSIQVGGAIGLAIVTAVVTSQAGANGSPSQVLDAFRPGLAVATGVAALGLAVALSGVLLRERHAEPATAAKG
jgi:EmrB/QacA subfamily drug resistance transporter